MSTLFDRTIAESYTELLKTASTAGVTSTLTVIEDGDATASALQLSTSTVKSSGNLEVVGPATLSSTLLVSGASTLTGNVNLGSALSVSGAATLSSTLGVSDTISAIKATGTGLAVTSNAIVGGTLGVTGASTLTGNTSVGGTFGVTGATTLSSTLAVTGNTTMSGNLTVSGDLTVNGATTNINTTNLVVEDKNVVLADVSTPTNTTADGGGITLKGTTDKTLNWVNATGAWTSSEDFNLLSGKVYEINGTSVLSATTLGGGVTSSSLTSVGTIGTGVWQGTIVDPAYGGTGVNNSGKTITLGGNLTTSGSFATTLTSTGTTSVTLPTTGTLSTLNGSETLSNKTLTSPTVNNGSLNMGSGTVVLPGSASPGQTAEGSVVWDTDDDLLTVGTGSGRKTMVDTDSTQTLTNKTVAVSPTITLGGDLSGSLTLTNLAGGTLSATLADNVSIQQVEVSRNGGVTLGNRKRINFVEGSNVTINIADNSVSDQLDVAISAAGGGGGGGSSSAADLREVWLFS